MNKWILVLFILGQHMLYSQSVDEYQWKNRLLFILNPQGEQLLEHEQVVAFKGLEEEIEDRELILFIVNDSNVLNTKGAIVNLDRSQIPYNSFSGIMLIGKDGGVKMKKSFLVSPQEVFDLIDSMPMRRAEIKKSKQY